MLSSAERGGVAAHEVERPLVHVDRPDRRVRRLERERQGDRSPPAPEIQQVPTGRRRGSVGEQHRGAGVDVLRTEHAAGGRHLDVTPARSTRMRRRFSALAGDALK